MTSDVIDGFERLVRATALAKGQRLSAESQLVNLRKRQRDAAHLSADWNRAADLLRTVSDEQSERLRSDLEGLVSRALSAVFDDGLTFSVTTRILRGAPAVEFSLTDSAGVVRPVIGSHGGGVAQVVAFVLRVVVVLLSPVRPVLVLDEPFSMVSSHYRPRLARFIREVVDSTSLQLVLVTHDDEMPAVADRHYAFTSSAGRTLAREVTDA